MKIFPEFSDVKKIADEGVNTMCCRSAREISFGLYDAHRNHEDSEKCVDPLLYAGIRAGRRNLGTDTLFSDLIQSWKSLA